MICSQFSKAMIKVAYKTSLSPEEKSKGWYNYSENIIQPLVDKRYEVLISIRQNSLQMKTLFLLQEKLRKI